jgi:HAMP domain/His Kinase A (phospho-acceptor) domain
VRLIESTPPGLHQQIVRTASVPHLRFWIAGASAVAEQSPDAGDELRRRLELLLEDGRELVVFVRDEEDEEQDATNGSPQLAARAGPPAGRSSARERWFERHPPGLLISARLADGRWLNAGMSLRPPPPRRGLPTLLSMGLMAIALSVIVVVMVRRITRPMARLALAAESMGRGETVVPIAEEGPLDVRQATRAFNRMQERLQRFLQDRTRMLAAISHDLRTPITSLRLRAEFIDDEETRAKVLETLDEMQRMTEATLAFAREEATREDTRTVDLAALIESLCEDLVDLGRQVVFEGNGKTPYACRPVSLKRAIRNLVEKERGDLRRARARRARARRRRVPDRHRRRRPGHSRGGVRARLRALRPARAVAERRDRRDRARHGDRPLNRARPRRRHRAGQPGGRRPSRDHPATARRPRLSCGRRERHRRLPLRRGRGDLHAGGLGKPAACVLDGDAPHGSPPAHHEIICPLNLLD